MVPCRQVMIADRDDRSLIGESRSRGRSPWVRPSRPLAGGPRTACGPVCPPYQAGNGGQTCGWATGGAGRHATCRSPTDGTIPGLGSPLAQRSGWRDTRLAALDRLKVP